MTSGTQKTDKRSMADYHLKVGSQSGRSDIELLQAIAKERDQGAFEEFLGRYSGVAFSVAKQTTRNADLASDIVQESMFQVWRSASEFRPGSARTWLLSIVIHRCYDTLRKQRRSSRQAKTAREREAQYGEAALPPGESDRFSALSRALGTLSSEEHRLVTLYFGANCSQAQIGLELGVSQRTVSERLRCVLSTLRAELKRSGVAATVALESELEALFAQTDSPPEALVTALRARITSVPPKTAPRPWVLGVALVLGGLAVTGAVWDLYRTRNSPENEGQGFGSTSGGELGAFSHPSGPEGPRPTPPQRVLRRWNFNSPELPAWMRVETGQWRWLPKGGPDGSGCASLKGDRFMAILDLPHKILPVRASFQLRVVRLPGVDQRDNNASLCGVLWGNSHWIASVIGISEPVTIDVKRDAWLSMSAIIGPQASAYYVNGALTRLCVGEPIPESRLIFGLKDMDGWIDNLQIEQLEAAEPPDLERYRNAVLQIPPTQRKGIVLLPQLKPRDSKTQVYVNFEH